MQLRCVQCASAAGAHQHSVPTRPRAAAHARLSFAGELPWAAPAGLHCRRRALSALPSLPWA
eukprot:5221636-Alexandrium_andersonii.AAC.1